MMTFMAIKPCFIFLFRQYHLNITLYIDVIVQVIILGLVLALSHCICEIQQIRSFFPNYKVLSPIIKSYPEYNNLQYAQMT
jgi:hypothetical protein